MSDLASSVAFIGGGNMASALIGGLVDSAIAVSIRIAEPNEQRRQQLSRRFATTVVIADNAAAVRSAQTVILATKPDTLPVVCHELRAAGLTASRGFVSVAAGVSLARLRGWLGPTAGLIRAMPNQPATVKRGLCTFVGDASNERDWCEHVTKLFAATGSTLWLRDESLMNASTAVSGSGPAYFFRFMEVLEDYARNAGFSAEDARHLSVATAAGAAELASSTTTALRDLRAAVTSPGGTTAAALRVLDDADFHAIFSQAIDAAVQRGIELDTEVTDHPND
ncbi:MAG: pyrroline-5-carboxylate reductase [Pseudomonadota bacterium]